MDFESFLLGYITAALWSSVCEDGTPMDSRYDTDDLSEGFAAECREECQDFWDNNMQVLLKANKVFGYSEHAAGVDFWLTRNRHGAGFWDRGMGQVGVSLTDAAHVYGGVDLFVDADGKVGRG